MSDVAHLVRAVAQDEHPGRVEIHSGTLLTLLDRLEAAEAKVARVEALVEADAKARADCAALDDCPCAFKDCYECGKWHACTHGPFTAITAALEDPR